MFKVQNNDRSVQRSVSTFHSIAHSGLWRPVVPSARSTQLASDVTWLWRTARPSQRETTKHNSDSDHPCVQHRHIHTTCNKLHLCTACMQCRL